MTIKPQKNQPNDESLQHQDGANQNNARIAVNAENQPPLRNIYDENLRLRRSPHKSSSRLKHKREHENIQPPNTPICNQSVNSNNSQSTNSNNNSTNNNDPNQSLAQNDEPVISGYNSGDEHNSDSMLTAEQWKERDDEFIEAIAKRNLVIEEILDDGACLFRAIALQIYGDQEMHDDIRQQTMDYIQINKEYFAQFVTEDITKYISRKRKTHVHGNHIEIQAISEMYNRAVELFSYQTEPINIFRPEQLNNGYEPFRLSYHRSSHYNAIIDPFKESVGVGLGLSGCRREDGSVDRKKLCEAVRLTQQQHIEQAMLEDKLKKSDWDATNEAIEEQTARVSYLEYCRENLLNQNSNKTISSTITSTSQIETDSKIVAIVPQTNQDDDGSSSSASSTSSNRRRRRRCRPTKERLSKMSGENFQIQYNVYQLKRSKYTSTKKEFNEENDKPTNQTTTATTSTAATTSSTTTESAGPSCDATPSTSQSQTTNLDEDKPVSQFYQSLLESSYTNEGQLSESEMVRAAILVSRAEYIDHHNILITLGQTNNDEDDSL